MYSTTNRKTLNALGMMAISLSLSSIANANSNLSMGETGGLQFKSFKRNYTMIKSPNDGALKIANQPVVNEPHSQLQAVPIPQANPSVVAKTPFTQNQKVNYNYLKYATYQGNNGVNNNYVHYTPTTNTQGEKPQYIKVRKTKINLPPHESPPLTNQTRPYYQKIEKIVTNQILNNGQRFYRHHKTGFIRPVSQNINSPYGMRFHPKLKRVKMHTGVDFAAPTGTPIRAVADGVVTMSRYNGGYGKMVLLDHDNRNGSDWHSLYGHASKLVVKVGQRVKQGQIIAYVGSTGRSTGPHLHFELFENGKRLNPAYLIPSKQTV